MTYIIRTDIPVITVKLHSGHTYPSLTSLLTVAYIMVSAVLVFITPTARNGRKHTSAVRIAGILRTAIPVITHQRGTGLTTPVQTVITRGAGTGIITGYAVIGVLTA